MTLSLVIFYHTVLWHEMFAEVCDFCVLWEQILQ